jgi:hypothetical protein
MQQHTLATLHVATRDFQVKGCHTQTHPLLFQHAHSLDCVPERCCEWQSHHAALINQQLAVRQLPVLSKLAMLPQVKLVIAVIIVIVIVSRLYAAAAAAVVVVVVDLFIVVCVIAVIIVIAGYVIIAVITVIAGYVNIVPTVISFIFTFIVVICCCCLLLAPPPPQPSSRWMVPDLVADSLPQPCSCCITSCMRCAARPARTQKKTHILGR